MISVFGAGGDRDRDKRPKMGRAGAELSDLAIVTSDNPRSEDPEAIIAEVARRGRGRARSSRSSVDRRAAIALALERAEPGDTVVIAGKGHEQGQEFEDGRKIPFDDREVAREELLEAGQPGVKLDAGGDRRRDRGRGRSPRASRARRGGRRSTPARPARATSSSACAGATATAASSPPRRSRPAPGAWSSAPSARRPLSPDGDNGRTRGAWVFAVEDPLAALQALARAWRRALGARVVGVTGSVGKTSVKDIARALLPGRVHANRENLNTEIGLPLTDPRSARRHRDCWCWRWRCAAPGQIAELAAIAEPEVAVITNVGPVHVELLGSVEAIAAAKAEILDDLPPGGDRGRPGRGRRAGAAPGAERRSCCASARAATSRRPR